MHATQFVQELPPNGAPAIFVQVTRFKCGGLVLAVTFNHMHVDGHAFFTFMRAWSDISRTNTTAIRVDHNRAQLEAQSFIDLFPKDSSESHSESEVYVDLAPGLKPWAMKYFEVGASTIKALKEEAKSSADGRGWVSTGDCIMAQLFRTLQVLRPSLVGEEEIVVHRAVEGRSRFYDSPVPDVCGNSVVCLLPPQIAREEVLQMPLVSIASKFREMLETSKREQWLGPEVAGISMESLGNKDLKPFMVTSWVTFGIYEVDFGFGKPYFALGNNALIASNSFGGAIILPPIPSSSSSVATIFIYGIPELLQALGSDPQFGQLFKVPAKISGSTAYPIIRSRDGS